MDVVTVASALQTFGGWGVCVIMGAAFTAYWRHAEAQKAKMLDDIVQATAALAELTHSHLTRAHEREVEWTRTITEQSSALARIEAQVSK